MIVKRQEIKSKEILKVEIVSRQAKQKLIKKKVNYGIPENLNRREIIKIE